MKIELNLSNYATKANLNEVSGILTFMLVSKKVLHSLKTEVDNLDVNKFKTVPADLSTLSDVVDNVVKKYVCDKLVTEVNAIHTKIQALVN